MILESNIIYRKDAPQELIERFEKELEGGLKQQVYELIKNGGSFTFGKVVKQINDDIFDSYMKRVKLFIPYKDNNNNYG